MLKSDLEDKLLAENPHLSRQQVRRILDNLFGAIIDQLAQGGRVELRGLGSFSTRVRKGRTARNPKTGALVELPLRRAVHFQPGKRGKAGFIDEQAAANGSED